MVVLSPFQRGKVRRPFPRGLTVSFSGFFFAFSMDFSSFGFYVWLFL